MTRTAATMTGTPRLRPEQRAAMVAPALLCAALLVAPLVPGFLAVTRLEPTSWQLVAVDGRYVTIFVRPAAAGCSRLADVRLYQTADSVTIATYRQYGDDLCGGDGGPSACQRVKLRNPLGERRLVHHTISPTIGPRVEDLAVTAGLVAHPFAASCAGTEIEPAAVQPFSNRVHVAGSSGTSYS